MLNFVSDFCADPSVIISHFIFSLQTVQSDYGIPMQLKYTMKQNKSVSEELLSEMVSINKNIFHKIAKTFLSIDFDMCFGYSKEPTYVLVEK